MTDEPTATGLGARIRLRGTNESVRPHVVRLAARAGFPVAAAIAEFCVLLSTAAILWMKAQS